MPMKPSGKPKKSTKSPPTSEKGMKRNAISTASWQSPFVGSSEDWISLASRACSWQWQSPFAGSSEDWMSFACCGCSSQMRPRARLSFADSDSTTLTSSDMRKCTQWLDRQNAGSALARISQPGWGLELVGCFCWVRGGREIAHSHQSRPELLIAMAQEPPAKLHPPSRLGNAG